MSRASAAGAGRAAAAVVVMGKPPRPGQVKTRLARALSPTRAAELYHAFLLDTLSLVDRAHDAEAACSRGFDRVLALALGDGEPLADASPLAPPPWRLARQQGADLGARIAAARAESGASSVVIVGSDAPDLPSARIGEALAHLAEAPREGRTAVLGPTADGGYYLLASAAPVPELLLEIPWSTPAVLGTTRSRARAAGIALVELEPWADVDELEDLLALRARLRGGDTDAGAAVRTRARLRALGDELASLGSAD